MTLRTVTERRRQHFELQRQAMLRALDREQLEQRVRSLARDGMSERAVAELVGLHIEQVRRVLAERTEVTP